MNTEQQEREAFEAWAGAHFRHAEEYTLREYQRGWEAWKARAALAVQPQAAQEPVSESLYREKCANGEVCIHGCHKTEDCFNSRQQVPSAPAQPARKPLDVNQIDGIAVIAMNHEKNITRNLLSYARAISRAIEAAHGITGDNA